MFSCNTAGRGKGGMREAATAADSSAHVQLQHGGKGEGGNEGGRDYSGLINSCSAVTRREGGGGE